VQLVKCWQPSTQSRAAAWRPVGHFRSRPATYSPALAAMAVIQYLPQAAQRLMASGTC
jgi:hypothetical protein